MTKKKKKIPQNKIKQTKPKNMAHFKKLEHIIVF